MATSTIPAMVPKKIHLNVYDINKGNIGPTNQANITATINCGNEIPIAVVGFKYTGTGSYSITSSRRRFTIDKTNHTIDVAIRVYTAVASITVNEIHCFIYYLTIEA